MQKNNFWSVMLGCSCFVGATMLAVGPAAKAASPAGTYFKATPSQAIKNAVPYAALPLPMSDVRLTGGPLKQTQDLDADYLLKLEPDRMLYYLRVRAGLEQKAQQGYGGWDGDGRQLTGHIAGHYLSAVSYMWAATGDPRFKERADYIVKELKEIQDKQGDGYIGALMANAPRSRGTNSPASGATNGVVAGNTNNTVGGGTNNFASRRNQPVVDGKQRFEDLAKGVIQSGGFDLNGMWSPWYVQHKLYAGLRDAYRLTGNKTALEVEIKFAEWADGILSKLSDAQIQRMLATEFGGMNEVMADLYADTGDKRWLKACDYFQHQAIVAPLSRHEDILGGKHGNTQVPKLLGNLMRFIYTGEARDGFAASYFWDAVAQHHSFATGGHGYDEYFGPPDKLSSQVDGSGQRSQDLRTAESCNVYNMLKMTRVLFALNPDEHYAAFHERALFNHVLASMDLNDGRTCYMVPIGLGVAHEYQDMFRSFTCCVGSGMESHALHGDGIYYESGDKLWVNLYAPSTAEWKALGLHLVTETTFPEGDTAKLNLTLKAPQPFTLALRRPLWAGDGFSVKVNGDEVKDTSKPGSYVELNRTWKNGDSVELRLPKALRAEPLPDNPNRVALLWGPLVLGGDLGPDGGGRGRRSRGQSSFPVFLTRGQPLDTWLKPIEGKPGAFHATGTGTTNNEVQFAPFYQMSERRYGIYWDIFTADEWAKKSSAYASDDDKRRRLEAATVSYAQPGEMQPERDYNFHGEDSTVVRAMDQPGRRGKKWFSFDLPVDPAHPMALVVTYHSGEETRRTFDVLVDGRRLSEQSVEKSDPARFYDVDYAVPNELVQHKQKVTVRFEATRENEIAGVFGVRMIRADAER